MKSEQESLDLLPEEERQNQLHSVALVAIRVLDYLKNNLPKTIATIESMQHMGNNLDRSLNKFRANQLTSMVARAQHEYESATEVQAVIDLVTEFSTVISRLCVEVNKIFLK